MEKPKKMANLTKKEIEKRRKQFEGIATFGLLLICVGLVSPLTNIGDLSYLSIFRWIYGAGVVIFLIARIFDVTDPEESLRLRRLRRMEVWAGISFAIALFFWFYDEYQTLHNPILPVSQFGILRNTIMFSLVGGVIQIIAAFQIYRQQKKEISGKKLDD